MELDRAFYNKAKLFPVHWTINKLFNVAKPRYFFNFSIGESIGELPSFTTGRGFDRGLINHSMLTLSLALTSSCSAVHPHLLCVSFDDQCMAHQTAIALAPVLSAYIMQHVGSTML